MAHRLFRVLRSAALACHPLPPPRPRARFLPCRRCRRGSLFPTFLALAILQEFGLPLLAPSKAKNDSFAQGTNFAITGANALDTEFFEKRGLGKTVWSSGSLFTQIQWLRDLKPSFCNSTQECKEFFAGSLFVVGEFGGNDCNAPLFTGKDLNCVGNEIPAPSIVCLLSWSSRVLSSLEQPSPKIPAAGRCSATREGGRRGPDQQHHHQELGEGGSHCTRDRYRASAEKIGSTLME